MISGIDKVVDYKRRFKGEFIARCFNFIEQNWLDARIQLAEGDELEAKCYKSFHGLEEVFIFKDRPSFESWKKLGAVDENKDTMIHVLETATQGTLVVDTNNIFFVDDFIESMEKNTLR